MIGQLVKYVISNGLDIPDVLVEYSPEERSCNKHPSNCSCDPIQRYSTVWESFKESSNEVGKIYNPREVSLILLHIVRYSLPEPIFTFQAYDSFLMLNMFEDDEDRELWCRELIMHLPSRNRSIAHHMLTLATEILGHFQKNQITLPKLSELFCHLFLRPRTNTYYRKNDLSKELPNVMAFVISHYTSMFLQPATYAPRSRQKSLVRVDFIKPRSGSFRVKHPIRRVQDTKRENALHSQKDGTVLRRHHHSSESIAAVESSLEGERPGDIVAEHTSPYCIDLLARKCE